ncbi:hypothetical protein FS837_000776 [Tulasnella sp. UAMH 9824]|nr:hypothetical protein FS837_000776 [Tulasnella sp. UAMH 9824]
MINATGWFWGSFRRLQFGRQIETDQVLQVESIKHVINTSKDPDALYHAALNLRSITDPQLLKLICEDESTTRGLREWYLESLEELEKKRDTVKQNTPLLQKTLAFGTAFFHVSLSAATFDDFLTIIGMKDVTLPLSSLEISPQGDQSAGESCRQAQSFVRQFMNLQMYRLGRQPIALTSTTLAANAFWYAVNGISHSQDLIYGDQFREALTSSEVSWAGLGLLASVSNNPCPFDDASQKRPYELKQLNWYREAFLLVKEIYSLHEPTQALADAVHSSLRTRKNLESNAILFSFSWRLFSRDGEEDSLTQLGESALSEGHHLICGIEDAIRSEKSNRSREVDSYERAIESLKTINSQKARGTEEASLKALVAEVAITAEEATSALKALSAQKALRSGSTQSSTSPAASPPPVASPSSAESASPVTSTSPEAFVVAFRAARGALGAIGALAELKGLKAWLDSKPGGLSEPVSRALAAIGSQPGNRARVPKRAQASIRALAVIGSLKAMRALAARRSAEIPQEGSRPQEGSNSTEVDSAKLHKAISQAATSARRALRAQKATEEHESARKMCFDAMIECMGRNDAEFSNLKRTAWRQRLALKTATDYMNHIKRNKSDDDNEFAKSVMERIYAAQIQDEQVISALGTEHVEIKQKFEEAFSALWPGANDGLQQLITNRNLEANQNLEANRNPEGGID